MAECDGDSLYRMLTNACTVSNFRRSCSKPLLYSRPGLVQRETGMFLELASARHMHEITEAGSRQRRACSYRFFIRGSSASRSPSPRKFSENRVIASVMPEKTTSHQ